jgi:hypothetical protein
LAQPAPKTERHGSPAGTPPRVDRTTAPDRVH